MHGKKTTFNLFLANPLRKVAHLLVFIPPRPIPENGVVGSQTSVSLVRCLPLICVRVDADHDFHPASFSEITLNSRSLAIFWRWAHAGNGKGKDRIVLVSASAKEEHDLLLGILVERSYFSHFGLRHIPFSYV